MGILNANWSYSIEAYSHLNKVKSLKNKHDNFNIQFIRTLVLLEKFDKALAFSKSIWNKDELFFEELRNKYTEGKIESIIIHNEAFELYPNLRKARIAQKQSKSHKIRSSFRLNIKTIIIDTPVSLLPGVIFILALRTIAKRILPVESGTSR